MEDTEILSILCLHTL